MDFGVAFSHFAFERGSEFKGAKIVYNDRGGGIPPPCMTPWQCVNTVILYLFVHACTCIIMCIQRIYMY